MEQGGIKIAKRSALCPISHKLCNSCALYRGRHYNVFASCEEYLRRLHEAAAPQKKAKEAGYPQHLEEQDDKTYKLPKLKVSRPWHPEETFDIEDAQHFPFDEMGTIVAVEGQVIKSYKELVQLVAQDCYKDKEFVGVLIGPAAIGGG